MRVAIVSDIHSNLPALEAVKDRVEQMAPDLVICAGDVVGYGASPNECCMIMAGWSKHTVFGNHDFAALRRDPDGMNQYAARAIRWTADALDAESKAYLGRLKGSARLRMGDLECVVHHGSLRSIWEYLYEEDVNQGMLDEAGAQVLVFGHTHVPYVRRYQGRVIVNPGSVGQPRDGDPRASFAILERAPLRCDIVRVDYDIQSASDAILGAGLPDMLAERLFSGF